MSGEVPSSGMGRRRRKPAGLAALCCAAAAAASLSSPPPAGAFQLPPRARGSGPAHRAPLAAGYSASASSSASASGLSPFLPSPPRRHVAADLKAGHGRHGHGHGHGRAAPGAAGRLMMRPDAGGEGARPATAARPASTTTMTTTARPMARPDQEAVVANSAAAAAAAAEAGIYERAIRQTLAWVALAGVFSTGLLFFFGQETAEEFVAGYLVEQSLSVDNLFVFLVLFDYFRVPLAYQDRVLSWGIYGAVVMRGIMIGLGAVALYEFRGVLLVFAGILIYSSAQVLVGGEEEEEEDMGDNAIVQFAMKVTDSTDKFDGDRFFTMVDGVRKATPLFLCMVAVEISDVVFAVDSVPAVFGVTENPLIVFTSNMFAIMGLRSLYVILSKAAKDLEYLEPAVAIVLGFIGSKMIAEYFGYEIPTPTALAFVGSILAGGIGLSVYTREGEEAEGAAEIEP